MKHVNSWMYFWTQNVMVLFLFVSFLSASVFSLWLCHIWLLTALSAFFCLPPHSSFPYICPLSLFRLFCLSFIPVSFLPSPLCLGLPFLPFSLSFPPLLPLCRVWPQERSGLSPAVRCGRHGEDAGAGLEVCVHVPAGVLQGSGDQGPG